MTIDFSCQDRTDELCKTKREHLARMKVTIVGVGALGTAASNAMVRSGCASITLIDDDAVEISNLPRQTLFSEEDIGKDKVAAAAERLRGINGKADITPIKSRLGKGNADALLKDADIILDCTDNLETRRIIDECCSDQQKPWVHAAVIRGTGEVMAVMPGGRRYADIIKGKTVDEDCAKQGVLSVAAIMTGTLQAIVALRILTGEGKEFKDCFYRVNAWDATIDRYKA